ncbi:amino acid ABC transporter permease [Bifidobacterium pseudolongum]|jgi:polar amino acid transport system permease protein|uniref:Polar amino acid ABC transporter permease n=4 Tax=Bifidobacterium pseudolongum TaxID=1694 RepID=A0A0A7I8S9_9BIFI|nr:MULTISPECIES: amino acid ABC transporter permease [Bifidobacterium]AIZ16667.1 polar amino acid ABC transporter permease [Bifidobacterium pseudolongum PV8-2]ASW23935.1 amino ABC transporter, permease, 3-TM region, His/Glu/Gln/Arg/opine family domain protein [Bifidobacterium pseudolongum]ATO39679.1 polar amino acid ABC transporter permease [Bifidobacterium pseudolongum subsp. globosum DSM 20092]KFI76620.1 ABC transporter permease [Bifidobacterium pseudolongum subsp. globosum]KFI80114.1 ABC tr
MLDWAFVSRYAPFFVTGAEMTLFISVFGIALAILTGLVCAAIETARIPVLRQIVRVYIEVSRNTPLLVQLYFLYFGLPKLGFVWSAEMCAIIGLGFLGGSYMSEAMRAGLEAVPQIQRENAYMLGLSSRQTMLHVVIPQAISTSIPGVVANVIFLIKESSVVSAIALADVMYMAKDLIGMYYTTYEALFLLIVTYLIILLPISIIGTWLERRFDYAKR